MNAELCHQQIQSAGFWRRLAAFALDSLMIALISTALIVSLFGLEFLQQLQQAKALGEYDWRILALEQGLPAIWAIGFWCLWMATPGKLLMDVRIVDANSIGPARLSQLVIRYLGYILSSLPLGLGFLWIAFDKRKQGWHDKLSKTRVIMQDDSLIPLEAYRD